MSNSGKLLLATLAVAVVAAALAHTKPGRSVLAKLGIAVACYGSDC